MADSSWNTLCVCVFVCLFMPVCTTHQIARCRIPEDICLHSDDHEIILISQRYVVFLRLPSKLRCLIFRLSRPGHQLYSRFAHVMKPRGTYFDAFLFSSPSLLWRTSSQTLLMAKTGTTDNCNASVDVSAQRETKEHLAFTEMTAWFAAV